MQQEFKSINDCSWGEFVTQSAYSVDEAQEVRKCVKGVDQENVIELKQ